MRELSGDTPLTRREQLQYMALVFARGISGIWTRVPTARFNASGFAHGSTSFFRTYVNALITRVVPTYLSPRSIAVFDIGCGSGYIRGLLSDAGYTGTYTGLDVVFEERFKNFENPKFAATFILSPVEACTPEKKYDLVISNTSLEHIPDDAKAIAVAHAACREGGVEVHIIPSFWSFFLYVWHGYRHYTPRRLKKLFQGTNYMVYPLGGFFSTLAHFVLITIPERMTGGVVFRTKNWYPKVVEHCIRLDRVIPLFPFGYGVIVTHDGAH